MIDVIIKIPFLPEEDDTEFQELKFKIPIRSDFNYLAGLLLSLPEYSMIAGYDFHPCDGNTFASCSIDSMLCIAIVTRQSLEQTWTRTS